MLTTAPARGSGRADAARTRRRGRRDGAGGRGGLPSGMVCVPPSYRKRITSANDDERPAATMARTTSRSMAASRWRCASRRPNHPIVFREAFVPALDYAPLPDALLVPYGAALRSICATVRAITP